MIAICSNPYRDTGYVISNKVASMLQSEGFSTVQLGVFTDDQKNLSEYIPDLDLVIVIGGDGTILQVANELTGTEIPLVGVNLGTMGFMASVEKDHLETLIPIAKGEYDQTIRSMIDVRLLRDGKEIYSGCALNDAVIHGCGSTIGLSVFADDCHFTSLLGDGVIVSTPTGSTGYCMSAGGPIMEPEVHALLVSPVCAHSLCARTFVLTDRRTITVQADRIHDDRAYLAMDGASVSQIIKGDLLEVKKSQNHIVMVSEKDKKFLSSVIDKLV